MGLGLLTIWFCTSVLLNPTWARTWLVVPMLIPPRPAWNVPVPTATAWVSFIPENTRGRGVSPSSSATSGRTVPTHDRTGTSCGSFSRSRPDMATSSSSYCTASSCRLSVRSIMNGGHAFAVPFPASMGSAAAVHPQYQVHERSPVRADGHDRGELAGDAHPDDLVSGPSRVLDDLLDGAPDSAPYLLRFLLRAVRRDQVRLHGARRRGRYVTAA